MASQFPILLVDDDTAISDILTRAAERAFPEANFIHVSSFNQAAAYLEGLEGKGPRLVLLDIDLQTGLSGFDFLSLLRQHPQGKLVPVIVLSSSQEESKAKEAYQRGANAYTPKPFSYPDWKSYVQQLRSYWFGTVTIPTFWFDNDTTQ